MENVVSKALENRGQIWVPHLRSFDHRHPQQDQLWAYIWDEGIVQQDVALVTLCTEALFPDMVAGSQHAPLIQTLYMDLFKPFFASPNDPSESAHLDPAWFDDLGSRISEDDRKHWRREMTRAVVHELPPMLKRRLGLAVCVAEANTALAEANVQSGLVSLIRSFPIDEMVDTLVWMLRTEHPETVESRVLHALGLVERSARSHEWFEWVKSEVATLDVEADVEGQVFILHWSSLMSTLSRELYLQGRVQGLQAQDTCLAVVDTLFKAAVEWASFALELAEDDESS